jgi:hypothetical protein
VVAYGRGLAEDAACQYYTLPTESGYGNFPLFDFFFSFSHTFNKKIL